MSPIVQQKDPDFRVAGVKSSVRIPLSWRRKLDQIAKEKESDLYFIHVQLLRWSIEQPTEAPWPQEVEKLDTKPFNAYLPPHRWEQIDKEAARRGLSRNRVYLAHLRRALTQYDAERAAE